ncbi:hypothetical protein NBRC116594_25590 [Shimia sp. NS0008-38b]|uniref:hypothetical protein n=1 Tax=Shimia sp. NS0008-38b TaxID=3127653 RepID=UPI003105F0C4
MLLVAARLAVVAAVASAETFEITCPQLKNNAARFDEIDTYEDFIAQSICQGRKWGDTHFARAYIGDALYGLQRF